MYTFRIQLWVFIVNIGIEYVRFSEIIFKKNTSIDDLNRVNKATKFGSNRCFFLSVLVSSFEKKHIKEINNMIKILTTNYFIKHTLLFVRTMDYNNSYITGCN